MRVQSKSSFFSTNCNQVSTGLKHERRCCVVPTLPGTELGVLLHGNDKLQACLLVHLPSNEVCIKTRSAGFDAAGEECCGERVLLSSC